MLAYCQGLYSLHISAFQVHFTSFSQKTLLQTKTVTFFPSPPSPLLPVPLFPAVLFFFRVTSRAIGGRQIDNWFFTFSQPRRLYQGDTKLLYTPPKKKKKKKKKKIIVSYATLEGRPLIKDDACACDRCFCFLIPPCHIGSHIPSFWSCLP